MVVVKKERKPLKYERFRYRELEADPPAPRTDALVSIRPALWWYADTAPPPASHPRLMCRRYGGTAGDDASSGSGSS